MPNKINRDKLAPFREFLKPIKTNQFIGKVKVSIMFAMRGLRFPKYLQRPSDWADTVFLVWERDGEVVWYFRYLFFRYAERALHELLREARSIGAEITTINPRRAYEIQITWIIKEDK